MDLNTRINKTTAIVVPVLLIVLFTGAFFALPRTSIMITAYAAGIIAAGLFACGNLYFIGAKSGYPWLAAIPMTLWRYLITSTLLSAVFVIAEYVVPSFKIPVFVLIAGHIVVFAFFLVMLLLMHTGKAYIEDVDKKVEAKRQFLKELGADLMAAKENAPAETGKDIQAVIDAVRYSDPMSHESLAALEADIQDNATRLGQQTGPEQIRELCVTLIRQIKDRNNRVKALK
jgi:hypothetical protein